MRCIAAVDEDWGIGKDNHLLTKIPEDMKLFRILTTNKIVVMGRKTLESLPGGKPLKGRTNIVLTRNKDFYVKGAIIAGSVDEFCDITWGYDLSHAYCIGGESIYRQLLPLCDEAIITKIHSKFGADAFFLNLEEDEGWEMRLNSKILSYNGLEYQFTYWKRKD